ncbi:alcohol dehydrogenase catalytic domain-containing protein, partial [Erythrobacter sp. YJ-T3-07]|uniref:alcohol dehydrogenase catalytic domain-containing protein n=1 Tax=Erythrobacter sp. YJ-T3-07 TaxID=2793063 RepID=UPI0018D27866
MKAVKSVALGRQEIVTDVPRPSARDHPGFVLIKTKYVGINHCDYYFVDEDFLFQENATIGSECCGEVVEVAEEGCERFKVG